MAKKSPKQKNALGRGLGALLKDSPSPGQKAGTEKTPEQPVTFFEIPVSQIEANPYQPRTTFDQEALQELSGSIQTQGIIQPITVRKLSENKYQLIAGERRLQASRMAGLETIPAYIRLANDQQMVEMALIENIQRENLNAIEIALSYQRLITECSLKQEELGTRVGKKRATVNNYLRLLKLPPDIQAAIRDEKISMGHARALINVEEVSTQLSILETILKKDLSVRKVEALVRKLQKEDALDRPEKKADSGASVELKNLQHKLSSHFGTKVVMKMGQDKKGEIKIPFLSVEDLNRILEILDV